MACSEDVERVFNEHQRFEISGSRVDLWEPAEPEDPQAERKWPMICEIRSSTDRPRHGTREEPEGVPALAVIGRRLVQTLVPLSGPSNTNVPTSVDSIPPPCSKYCPLAFCVYPRSHAYDSHIRRLVLSREEKTDWNGLSSLLFADLRAESVSLGRLIQFMQARSSRENVVKGQGGNRYNVLPFSKAMRPGCPIAHLSHDIMHPCSDL